METLVLICAVEALTPCKSCSTFLTILSVPLSAGSWSLLIITYAKELLVSVGGFRKRFLHVFIM